MKKILLLVIPFFFTCEFSPKKEDKTTDLQEKVSEIEESTDNEINSDDDLDEDTSLEENYFFTKEELPLLIEDISKEEFLKIQKATKIDTIKPKKITDFKEAVKLLKGIVEFQTDETKDYFQSIKKIKYRNGVVDDYSPSFDEIGFVAYYPEEDILLCEGGHSSDILFNLTTGRNDVNIGDPDFMCYSPEKTVRLTAYYTGQSNKYLIQKRIGNRYVTFIEPQNVYYRFYKYAFDYLENKFWTDEKTLYIAFDEQYQKITIKDNALVPNDFSEFPMKNFPVKEMINKEIAEKLSPLSKPLATRLFGGLFAEETNLYANYALPYSDDFHTIVITVESSRYSGTIYNSFLCTISKNYDIIDMLPISFKSSVEGYENISKIHENEIVTENHFYFYEAPAVEYNHYKIDEKGVIHLTKKKFEKIDKE